MTLADRFIHFVREKKYWSNDSKVILAVSGGVDSMVLAELMNRLPNELRPEISIAHVNHQLRNESFKEEKFLKKWTEKLNIPLYIYRWPKEEHPKTGIEEAARKVRYDFFKEILKKTHATHLVTAHHLNDQAETILMKLVRGGLLEQFTGIKESREWEGYTIVRPLLSFQKNELIDYAKTQKIPFKEDESNYSLEFSRNRYRNQILPLLKEENQKTEEHLVSFAEDLDDLLHLIQPMVTQTLKKYLFKEKDRWRIDFVPFLQEDSSMKKFVLKELLKEIGLKWNTSFKQAQIPLLLDWLNHSSPNSEWYLPNDVRLTKAYENVWIEQVVKEKKGQDQELHIEKDQWIVLPEGVEVGLVPADSQKVEERDLFVLLDSTDVSFPLTLRHRKEGDRIKLKGSGGTKKVKDIFIDQKVPAKERDNAWLVEDQGGNLLWIVGYKESMLSLDKITDKIIYMLLFKNGKELWDGKRSL